MYREMQSTKKDRGNVPPALQRITPQRQPAGTVGQGLTAAKTPGGAGRSLNDIKIRYHSGKGTAPHPGTNPQDFSVNTGNAPDGTSIGESTGRGGTCDPSVPVIQRKIVGGEGAEGLEKVLAAYAAQFPDSTFAALFRTLNDHDEVIRLENGSGMSRYDPVNKKLYFKLSMFQQLDTALKDTEKTKETYETISSILSNFCHELSHVHDFIGNYKGAPTKESLKDDKMSDETFLSTEFRAWAREAISILEINECYGLAHNDTNKQLIEGWETLHPDMLDHLRDNRANLIIKRFLDYLKRRMGYFEMHELQTWIDDPDRKRQFKEQLTRFRVSVMGKIETLWPR